jgi:hypothetical protein
MSNRKFKCSLVALLGAGDTITGAALDTDYAPDLNLRLKPPYVADTVALIADIRAKHTERAGQQGDIGTLTLAEEGHSLVPPFPSWATVAMSSSPHWAASGLSRRSQRRRRETEAAFLC